MAAQAVFRLEVFAPRVTLPAFRNDLEIRGRMPPVAIEAAHLRGMGFAGFRNFPDDPRMALAAVAQGENRRRIFFPFGSICGMGRHNKGKPQADPEGKDGREPKGPNFAENKAHCSGPEFRKVE
jgi:hypothetical protein